MIISIHQPNFFPYEGVLEKMRQSDLFVLLNQAQYVRGNYHNRFKLNEKWFTLSVNQKLEPLIDKAYQNPAKDWEKIKRLLPDYASVLAQFDSAIESSLVATNTRIISDLKAILRIPTPLATDWPTSLRATDRLVQICQRFGATTYLSGASGPNYLEMHKFIQAGIRVVLQEPTQGRAALELLSRFSYRDD